MKTIFNIIMKIFYIIVPCSLYDLWERFVKRIYTAYIKNEFKYAGDVSINRGLNLLGGKYITIGNKTGLGKKGVLQAWDAYRGERFSPSIKIGDNCWIGDYFNISAINSIEIGNGVLTGRWVTILDNSHGKTGYDSLIIPPRERHLYSKGKVVIEDNVWIGDKVTILPGVKIGVGSIIGANSVVTKSVPPYSIVAGIPCNIIKKYDL